jgi:peptidoglycan hydrolase-like protein with peptidoglycan-binding domain
MVDWMRRPVSRPGRWSLAAGVVAVLVLPACSADQAASSPNQLARVTAPDEQVTTGAVEITSVEAETSVPASSIGAVSQAPTTLAETTSPPTTEPATTAPTTTVAPPTTPVPVTTAAPLPPANQVPVAPVPVPLAAVGGGSGPETARVQQRLLELGFWLQDADGNYGLTTRQAVMAFQKYLGIDASGEVDANTASLLTALTLRPYGRADSGTLVEIDKTRQLLFFVIDGRVQWVFNTSTGNGQPYLEEDQNSPGTLVEGVSLTPDGFHRVEREKPEGWWEGDLGQIYRPKYFVGGVAVHGSNSVPNYPASHGCVRVTTEAMDFIWNEGLMPMTLPVWVHQYPRPG